MLDKINGGLCIDQQRIFSTGFSFGGMMSHTLPFEFDVFRAVAPCSGKTGVIYYNEKFTDPVAIMALYGGVNFMAHFVRPVLLDGDELQPTWRCPYEIHASIECNRLAGGPVRRMFVEQLGDLQRIGWSLRSGRRWHVRRGRCNR
jgi:hypothetical protein